EQTILFSTNLQPEELVDEAFLRRVPFKIHIGDPSVEEFIDLFKRACEGSDVPWRPDIIERLVMKHYRNIGRPLRRCHPRDLLHQVSCLCAYRGERVELRTEFLDLACTNYFGNQPIMQSSAAMVAKPVGMNASNQNGPNVTSPVIDARILRPTPTSLAAQDSQLVRRPPLNSQPLNSQPLNSRPLNCKPLNSQQVSQSWRTEVIRAPSTAIELPKPLSRPIATSPNSIPFISQLTQRPGIDQAAGDQQSLSSTNNNPTPLPQSPRPTRAPALADLQKTNVAISERT
ncbi:MAG TPA: hypothetical protein VM260_22230, partial [Pirellula sp.]|nr:hypothetical protein [Pirellula sp.]